MDRWIPILAGIVTIVAGLTATREYPGVLRRIRKDDPGSPPTLFARAFFVACGLFLIWIGYMTRG